MKRPSYIASAGNKSGQVNTTPRKSSAILVDAFVVLGALTLGLWLLYTATNEKVYAIGFLAYLSGVLTTAVLIALFVLLSFHFRRRDAVPQVLAALVSTLQTDRDPRVRSKAVEGLAELDVEESFYHREHKELDDILISTLHEDEDPRVRSRAVEGLTELGMEESSYYHGHDKLSVISFDDGL